MLRTYNTLIIACNMCNQPREAMAVYKRMLDEGYTPNATTYNALISAHGKAGQLDKVGLGFDGACACSLLDQVRPHLTLS